MAEDWKNKLYFGDNLDIMREHIDDESIDLIYLDPPFNSKATYNILFDNKNGTQSGAQITAFDDTWHWGQESQQAYHKLVTQGGKQLADLIQAMRSFLGTNDMMAYLVMMAIRLVEMHRVLKQTGSIYLHCDPTASHYIKLIMDAIFSAYNFRNEINWVRSTPHGTASKKYGVACDIILYYSKSDNYVWNTQYGKYRTEYVDKYYSFVDDDGRKFQPTSLLGHKGVNKEYEWRGLRKHWRYPEHRLDELEASNRIYWPSRGGIPRFKRYLDEQKGMPLLSLWSDIPPVNSQALERLGYPTQKPEALLERIIKVSSNEGDLVMDPFCGCGTTIAVAERLGREWIGIDITNLAVTLMKSRLEDTFGHDLSPYEVLGDPKDLQGARALAEQGTDGRYQFEWWALGKIGARPAQDKKKGADKGIDGYLYFIDDESGIAKKIIVQVKSGHVKLDYIHALKGIIEGEKAVIGAFITLQEPTKPMKAEATAAGFYEPKLLPGKTYPKIQILTIEEILNGRQLEYPRVAPEVTFKRAERKNKGEEPEQGQLF